MTEKQNEYNTINAENIDESNVNQGEEFESEFESELEYNKKDKNKGLFNRKKYKKNKSPLKELEKEKRKQGKNGRPHMAFVALTLSLMIICLFVYSVAYMLSPRFSLEANIVVTDGGYNLEYDLTYLQRSVFDEDIEIGDDVYVNQYGVISKSPKNCISMKIVNIDEDYVTLEFNVRDVPTFIDTKTLKTVMQTEEVYGKQVSKVYINGKVIGGRFVLSRITLQQQSK